MLVNACLKAIVTDQELDEKAPFFSSLPLAKQKAISFFNYVYPDMICKNWLKMKYDIDQDFQDSDLNDTGHAISSSACAAGSAALKSSELSNGQLPDKLTLGHDEASEPFEDNEMQLQTIEVPIAHATSVHVHVDQLQDHVSSNANDDNIVLSDTESDAEDEKQPLQATSCDDTSINVNEDSTSTAENISNTSTETTSPGRANSKRKSDEFSDGDLEEETVLTAAANSTANSVRDVSATTANAKQDIRIQLKPTDATSNKNNSKRQRQDKNQTSAALDSSSSAASTPITASPSVATIASSSAGVIGQI